MGAGGKAHTMSTKRKRHTPEQVVRKLTEADRLLAQGADTAEVAPAGRQRADLLPVAQPVRGSEGRRRQAPQGAGEGERPTQAATGRRRVGEGRAPGDRRGKLLSPARRHAAVNHLQRTLKVSERFACRVVGQHRSTQRHTPASQTVEDPDAALRAWLREYAASIPAGVTDAPTTTPAVRAGPSTTRRSSGCGARKASAWS